MFAKAGIKKSPDLGRAHAAAQKLASSNAVPGGKPICLNPDWARMLAFVYQNRGSLANVQSPAAAAVNFYVGLIKKRPRCHPHPARVGWPGEALGKEKAAIIFEGNWVLPYMPANFPQVKFGVAPMVKARSTPTSGSRSRTRWRRLEEQGGCLDGAAAGSPASRACDLDVEGVCSAFALGRQGERRPQAFLSQGPFSRGWAFPNFDATYTIMNNDLQAVINGSMSTQQMLADVAARSRVEPPPLDPPACSRSRGGILRL